MTKQAGNRWSRLVAGVLMLLFAGVIYAWSILKAPLAAEFGWDNSQLGLNFTITMGFFCIGGILGSILLKRFSPRFVTILGGVICFLGFFLTGRSQGSIGLLYLTYGVMCGGGIGMAYNVIISTVSGWFPDKRATASGVMMMGFGTSSLVLGSIVDVLFSSVGWRSAYTILGVSICVVLLGGALLMAPAPAPKKTADTGNAANRSPKEMIKTPVFWMFYALAILFSAIGTCVISITRDVALSVGAAESLAVLLVGALSVCNGLSRVVIGGLFDAIGRKKTMWLASGISVMAVLLMLSATLLSSVPLITAGILFVGFSYGAMPTMTSGFISSMFGSKHFSTNFSIANTMLLIASFSSTLGGGILNATGSYTPIFLLLLACAAGGTALNFLIQRRTGRG